ncbi:MAG: inositol oxygenase family protein [Betaproteobacteria bacterium]
MAIELAHTWVENTPPAPRRQALPIPPQQALIDDYVRRAREIEARHDAQTVDDVAALRRKYAGPLLGRVSPWSLVERLGRCIDPTDQRLYCASQQMHVLQMIDAMEREGTANEEMLLVALVHDLGKVLLTTDEAPENIVCMNKPIRTCAPGGGLDNCVFQWNHDEFAYSRLKPYLPDGLAWLVRYHSILPATCEAFMDARDRDYFERYLRPFSRYDHGTKSPVYLPQRRIDDYRHVIERALPAFIDF